MSGLLTKHPIAVSCVGTLVVLAIGNVRRSLEFPLALQLAAAMKHEARMAKLSSGRNERGLHVFGVLHNAQAERPQRKRFMDRVPELLKPHGLAVYAEGQIVRLKIDKATAGLPYPVARTVAQWLRIRGKEAKRNAGERRHWSEIGNMPAVVNGAHV